MVNYNNNITRKEECDYAMKCPVCGNWVDFFDICDNCGYQNQGIDIDNGVKGPNKMTLTKAREAYARGEQVE